MSREKVPFLDVAAIKKRIPHRYPFLFVDRVEKYEPGPDPDSYVGRQIVATKNVSINEPFFAGHFPDQPIMPGVLLVEMMAQVGALSCVVEDGASMDVYIAKINHARFRRPVVPGDVLTINAKVISQKGTILGFHGVCDSFGERVCEIEVLAKIFPK